MNAMEALRNDDVDLAIATMSKARAQTEQDRNAPVGSERATLLALVQARVDAAEAKRNLATSSKREQSLAAIKTMLSNQGGWGHVQPAVKEPESHLGDYTPAAADLGPLVRAAEAMEARRDRDGTKPLRTQILAAERKIAKKKKKKSADAARQHCKDMEASIAAARRKVEEARRALENAGRAPVHGD